MIPFNWRIQPWIPDEFKGREEERLEQCMQIVILGLWTSRRTSVLINRLPYNDSSREQHNNEIYAGEIYGVITAREKREGEGRGWGKKWLTCFPTRRGIKMPLRSILNSSYFHVLLPSLLLFLLLARFLFPTMRQEANQIPSLFPRPREKYIFPSPRRGSSFCVSFLYLGNFI